MIHVVHRVPSQPVKPCGTRKVAGARTTRRHKHSSRRSIFCNSWIVKRHNATSRNAQSIPRQAFLYKPDLPASYTHGECRCLLQRHVAFFSRLLSSLQAIWLVKAQRIVSTIQSDHVLDNQLSLLSLYRTPSIQAWARIPHRALLPHRNTHGAVF